MKYQVFLNPDGYIEVVSPERHALRDMAEINRLITEIAKGLVKDGKPIKILIDSSQVKEWESGVSLLNAILLKNLSLQRIASFGANPHLVRLQSEVVQRANIQEQARICETRQEAEDWLDQSQP